MIKAWISWLVPKSLDRALPQLSSQIASSSRTKMTKARTLENITGKQNRGSKSKLCTSQLLLRGPVSLVRRAKLVKGRKLGLPKVSRRLSRSATDTVSHKTVKLRRRNLISVTRLSREDAVLRLTKLRISQGLSLLRNLMAVKYPMSSQRRQSSWRSRFTGSAID